MNMIPNNNAPCNHVSRKGRVICLKRGRLFHLNQKGRSLPSPA